MSDAAIKAEGAGKKYVIGHQIEQKAHATFRDLLVRKSVGLFQRTKNALAKRSVIAGHTFEEFWALKDVSFEVQTGEVVGIIGKNGAGKSTLLKLLSGITEPSAGRITTRGRVASLLEVGTGFHPELTGRENIFLNGAILGMTRADIRRRFDEIVAFSEVEKFLDTPVKRFSSGMYVRLAFSVAAHLEPDILIIDEVLAVGDAQFQKKCLGKIGEVSSQQGRTVLFVSHQMGMITSLCQRALLLDRGCLAFEGTAADAVSAYYNEGGNQPYSVDFTKFPRRIGNEFATLLSGAIEDLEGRETGEIDIGRSFKIKFSFALHRSTPRPPFPFIHVYNSQGQCVFVSTGAFPMEAREGIYESVCIIPKNLLNDDVYSIDLILTYMQAGYAECFHEKSALSVVIVDPIEDTLNGKVRNGYGGPFAGVVRPELNWEVRQVS
jgi:lipopolysaccharide transport system ATP-binding protein